jgi:hypothetical protein
VTANPISALSGIALAAYEGYESFQENRKIANALAVFTFGVLTCPTLIQGPVTRVSNIRFNLDYATEHPISILLSGLLAGAVGMDEWSKTRRDYGTCFAAVRIATMTPIHALAAHVRIQALYGFLEGCYQQTYALVAFEYQIGKDHILPLLYHHPYIITAAAFTLAITLGIVLHKQQVFSSSLEAILKDAGLR